MNTIKLSINVLTVYKCTLFARLQAMERVLASVSELSHIVGDYEETLLSHSIVSSDMGQLNSSYRDLQVC